VVLARRLAIAPFCLLVRLVQFLVVAVAGLAFLAAGLVMVVIALVMLAYVTAEAKCGRAARLQGCAGPSWSAAPATVGAARLR
jgi:hypothetical protein